MVYDKLENLGLYANNSEKMQKAIDYVMMTDFSNIKPGKYELLGSEVYAIVNEYKTKPIDEAKWESHKKYADIQYMIRGSEKMGFTTFEKVKSTEPYLQEKDIEFFEGTGNYVDVHEGEVCIFFPHDIHQPSIAIGTPQPIKKVVIKVLV